MENWRYGTKLWAQKVRVYGGLTINVIDVPGDGNCLFYSAAQQLSGKYSLFLNTDSKKKK